uniref:Transmembrane protein n=1 Tax=Strongyloides papillosus TaxID=174720 RepID=A0A0N5BYK0_STREA
MFITKNSSIIGSSYESKQNSLEEERLLQNPLNFESFFINPNTKTILENINKRTKYQRKKIDYESTIVSNTEHSQTNSLNQLHNKKNREIKLFTREDDYEKIKNDVESCSKSKNLQNTQHKSLYNNEKTEHNVEVTRDYKIDKEEIIINGNEENNNIFSYIAKPIEGFEIKEDNQEYESDIISKNENVNPIKKLNFLKKMDVKTCVWIFLSYACLDTFVAIYFACTPLQIAFIIMSMASLLFYKYT